MSHFLHLNDKRSLGHMNSLKSFKLLLASWLQFKRFRDLEDNALSGATVHSENPSEKRPFTDPDVKLTSHHLNGSVSQRSCCHRAFPLDQLLSSLCRNYVLSSALALTSLL